jgi:hypothetical protein
MPSITGGESYFSVNKPEASSSFVFCQALLDEVLDNLLGNSHARTSSSHEHGTMILNRNICALQCIDDTSQYDGSCSLNIIIEAGVFMLVLLKCWKGILEVLKLNNDT